MAYEDMTVVQLRAALKAAGKPVYGSKDELIERLAEEPGRPETADRDPDVESEQRQAPVGHRRVHEHRLTVADATYLSDDTWHAANKQACLREADRLGLLPVGGVEAVQVEHEQLPDGRVELTYTVPVARSS